MLLIHEVKRVEDLILKDRKGTSSDVGEHNNEKKNVTGSKDTGNASGNDDLTKIMIMTPMKGMKVKVKKDFT